MIDIKRLLLSVGEKLVQEYGFQPAHVVGKFSARSTEPLVNFLIWLDRTPEARGELENMSANFLSTLNLAKKNATVICRGAADEVGENKSCQLSSGLCSEMT